MINIALFGLRASIELECDNLLVITGDYEGTEKVHNKTIQFIPLWKWLCNGPVYGQGPAISGLHPETKCCQPRGQHNFYKVDVCVLCKNPGVIEKKQGRISGYYSEWFKDPDNSNISDIVTQRRNIPNLLTGTI